MSEKKLGTETIHVLNDKYQFVSAQQAVNAKWLDLDNVVSVKRDKTIYAIRARTSYDFNNTEQNCEFFCNLNGSDGISRSQLVRSSIYNSFNANTNIFEKNDYSVYGNSNVDAELNQLGWAGSLNNAFVYNRFGLQGPPGSINVDGNVSVFANSEQSNVTNVPDLNGNLYLNGNIKTTGATGNPDGNVVISNAYSTTKLFLSNTSTTKWNRLINANINNNVMVTASTDPCDMTGNAINDVPTVALGTAQTNEAYRYQFAVKRNAQTVSNENPIYMGRISRFGTNLSDVSGTMSSVMTVDSFTSNFFANLPSDNLVYYNKDKPLSEMSITGTYKSTNVVPFSSNYLDINIGNMSGNLLSSSSVFSSVVTINKYDTTTYNDYITNPNLTLESSNGELKNNDTFTVVQTDLGITTPLYLFDRLKVTSDKYKAASAVFSKGADANDDVGSADTLAANQDKFAATAALKSSGSIAASDSKVVHLSMYNIVANNWQSTSAIQPSLATPLLTGTPTMPAYTTGNTIELYLRRGFVGIDNYSAINTTVATTGSSYFNTIPSFLKSYSEPTDGIYIEDNTVTTATNLATNCVLTETFKNSDNINITANISPDLCFYVFASADVNNRVDKRANLVISSANVANTVISSIWNWSSTNVEDTNNTVRVNPKIVYNTFDGLSVENPFAKKNITYTVQFGKILGETNLQQEKASSSVYGFNANLSVAAGQGNVVSSTIANLAVLNSDYSLTNSAHLNDLLLNGVAYSEYEFTDFSYKFTDLGNIMSLDASNYKYSSVLPVVGNAAGTTKLTTVNDNFVNVIVEYSGVNIDGADNDVHRLAIYDNQYRYYINNVSTTGGGAIDLATKYTSDNNGDVFKILPGAEGTVGTEPDTTTQYIHSSSLLVYTYEKIYENSSNDTFYPFTTPNETYTERQTKKTDSDNYLFPGFVYKHSGVDAEFYNYKDETSCDFVINNNIIESEQSLSLVIFSADTNTKTLKVGLSTQNSTKSVAVRPIRLGGDSATAARQWYTPVVFKISGESNSYVVLLIKIKMTSVEVFDGLDDTLSGFTPIAVNINSIEKASDGSNQIQFKSKMAVYSSSSASSNPNTAQPTYTNIVNSHKTSLSNFSYSSVYGSSNTNVGINLFSIPTNNIVMLFAYKKSVIKRVMNYTQSDYELDNSVNYDNSSSASRYKKINRPISSLNFAASRENNTDSPTVDGKNPYQPARSTRFYLDQGNGGAVYVDYLYSSSVSLKNMGKFQLNRGLEWILTRQEEGSNIVETVGRGLLSKHPRGPAVNKKDYVIGENLGKAPSGFFMNVNTNIIDMASHLLVQKRQTGGLKMNTTPQFVLKTKSDIVSVSLFHQDPVSLVNTQIGTSKVAESRVIDLGTLFAVGTGTNQKVSRLPKFEFDLVRSLNNSTVNDANPSEALFRIRIRLDNYSLVHNKLPVNAANVLSSSLTNVSSSSLDLLMTFDTKRTLNHDFQKITNPSSFGVAHRLIKSFVHKGFGSVDMRVYDFTSHYDNELPSQELTTSMKSFNFPDSAAYSFTVPSSGVSVAKTIEYDSSLNTPKFYVNLGNTEFPDRLYFKGSGLSSLSTDLNDKETFLLYTGTRPIGFITYKILADTTLEGFTDTIPTTFSTNTRVFNGSSNGVNSFTGTGTAPGATYKMFYSVALTNRTSVNAIKVRGVSYKFNNNEVFQISTPLKYLFGVFRSLSDLLKEMKFNYKFGTVEGAYTLSTNYIGTQYATSNFEESTDKCVTYNVSSANEGVLFKLKLKGSVGDMTNFKVSVNPSKLYIYQALDVNENGELDRNISSVVDNNISGLGASAALTEGIKESFRLGSSFSELLYNLRSSPSDKLNYRAPSIVQTIDLNHDYNTIVGSGLDIKLNKKWAIGYNLDCFFTIRNNNVCTFDVISIDTDTQNTTSSVASLKVQNSLPLIVGNKNSWARSKGYTDDSNDHCGLTFKLKENVKIDQGDIVKLFVDNTPLSNNLQVSVNVANKESKSYKLSDYDNETYSRLLDKQIKLKNKFE